MLMKHKIFPKKYVVVGIMIVIALFGILCSRCAIDKAYYTNSSGVIEYISPTPSQEEKIEMEILLKEDLYNYDKNNIAHVAVYLEDLNNEIIHANIFIVSHKEITDPDQRDEIVSLAAENLNLNIEDISVDYMDVETFTTLETM